jgi:hypothetical protein
MSKDMEIARFTRKNSPRKKPNWFFLVNLGELCGSVLPSLDLVARLLKLTAGQSSLALSS